MYKEGKWAQQILPLQDEEGKWGWFHTLSRTAGAPLTTEMALRRLQRLGFTLEDVCIQRAVAYMTACLKREKCIPDAREKLHDWDVFTSLMLATWIREFTPHCREANVVAEAWAQVITHAFSEGMYVHEKYVQAYTAAFGMKPRGGRLVDFCSFYQVSLLRDVLDEKTQAAMFSHVLQHESGIYYVYDRSLCQLPERFDERRTSYYLAAVELLARYHGGREQLAFVKEWLLQQRLPDGRWDMGNGTNDKVYFPLSDNWRRAEDRIRDCTGRIEALIQLLP